MKPNHTIYAAIAFERFAWYAMLGALVLQRGEDAVGNLLAAAYLLPLLGGLLSAWAGLRTVTVAGALVLAAGYGLAAGDTGTAALGVLALGCGLFKPCLGTLLGSLHKPGPERANAYSRYYVAIQIGSAPSTLVGAWLRTSYGFWAVFAICAAAALVTVAILAAGWRRLQPARESIAEAVIDEAITRPQWGRLAALLVGAVVFFGAFQQQQTMLVVWARDICRATYPESLSSLNPLLCMLFLLVPAIGAWSSLRERLTCAMLSIGAAFALLVVAKHVGGTSLAWLCAWYVLGTLGEALISPLGMDFVTSLVPRRLSAVAMSLWLLAMSAGGKLAGLASPNTIGLTMGACLAAAAWFFVAERPRRAAVAVAEEATT